MLFDDDNYEINLGLFNMPGMDMMQGNRDIDVYSDYEGLMRGNMFKKLYKPYKNYTYLPLKANTEREKRLYKIMAICFAINDLNLYLDIYPDDKEAFNLFKKYNKELEIEKANYEKMYGPLDINSDSGSKYDWLDNPWPWDNEGGNMYV